MKLQDLSLNHWIQRAEEIATAAHEGQTRTDGRPYIEHPLRVAAAVDLKLRPIALLHDVVEDTKITLDDLRKEGFPPYILSAIDLLTHKKGDSNLVYWNKILTNKDAVLVKIADIRDNLNDSPSEYAKQKYARALNVLGKLDK